MLNIERPTDTAPTDHTLLSRLKCRSDHLAWHEFERSYGKLVLRFCRACGLQSCDADDVCQNVFVSLFVAMPRFNYLPQKGRFRAYLRFVTRNAVLRHLRASKRIPQLPLKEAYEYMDQNRTLSLDQAWEAAWVEHHYELAMRSLRSHCEPQSLEVFNGLLAGQEIRALARKFDMTEDAVRRTRVRIREQLRGLIAEQIRKDGEGHERRATSCAGP